MLCFGSELLLAQHARALAGMVRVDFEAADAWFEEDMPIGRWKSASGAGSSRRPRPATTCHEAGLPCRCYVPAATTCHEAGLPCRCYVPAASADRSVLRESETTTVCPYKGVANYYDVELENDEGEIRRGSGIRSGAIGRRRGKSRALRAVCASTKTMRLSRSSSMGRCCRGRRRPGGERTTFAK
ncbi:glutathione S- transferase, nitrogen catabolite repression regulator [Hypoxylon texense]